MRTYSSRDNTCKYNGLKQTDPSTYEISVQAPSPSIKIEIDPDETHYSTSKDSISKEGKVKLPPHVQSIPSISPEEEAKEANDTLNQLLFRSNSRIQELLKTRNESNEFLAGSIDFCKLNVSLNDILANKVRATQTFIECLDCEWNKYQAFTQHAALQISQYAPEKSVMITILRFNEFIWINQQCLSDIITQYDSISPNNTKLSDIWEWKLNWKPHKILFELIKKISNLYDDERIQNDDDDTGKGINNYEFDRKCTKYWVSHENVFQVIGIIIQHLPIYVYGQKSDSLQVYQRISSVYFDNEEFKCYHERIAKEEGARAVRIRWYDQTQPSKGDKVFFERKTHHCSSITDKPSIKQRFKIKTNAIVSFIKGNIDRDTALKQEIYEMIKELKLTPKTRTVCKRISFQFNHCNDLRISLDLNLTFIKENAELLDKEQWFTSVEDIFDDDVMRFSFDILEIKLAGPYVDDPPLWIQDLMESELLKECYKFSKYGQSVNEFYSKRVQFVPKWIEENQMMFEYRDKTTSYAKTPKAIDNGDTHREQSRCCVPFLTVKNLKRIRNRKRKKTKAVNPKVYFSNERTFLGWFQAAVFIGGSGLTINSIDRSDPAGYLLICVAAVVLLWAIVLYYKRNFKLLKGKMNGLHDFYGPTILVSVILFVFAYSLINGNQRV
eukprot:270204_1